MVEFDCYSSWVRRDDIIGKTGVSGSPIHRVPLYVENSIDGFYCKKETDFIYHSTRSAQTWFQVDLNNVYTLKCVRVTTRDFSSYFSDVEFRFGNESQVENYSKNHVIAFVGPENGYRFEFCLNYQLAGRYLGLRQHKNTWLLIGQIQITIQ